jgi:hypothetical protein
MLAVMGLLEPALASPPLGFFIGVIATGLVIGVFGHIIKSRPLIITGILLIGVSSVYFSFVLQPGGQ